MNIGGNNPVLLAFLGTLFTCFVTMLGASLVFFFKKINKLLLDIMLALSSGIMLAASFFSLIMPSLEMANELGMNKVIIPSIGFLFGGLLIVFTNKIIDMLHKDISHKQKRCFMLTTSISLHNFPEGLAIGVAFGSIMYHLSSLESAIMLAIGIGIQNFPEGAAVSIPLRREGYSRIKAFLYGSFSGVIEIIAGILGALLVLKVRILLPFCLSLAAGAMIYVIVNELIPECEKNEHQSLISISIILGFIFMMILDVLL